MEAFKQQCGATSVNRITAQSEVVGQVWARLQQLPGVQTTMCTQRTKHASHDGRVAISLSLWVKGF